MILSISEQGVFRAIMQQRGYLAVTKIIDRLSLFFKSDSDLTIQGPHQQPLYSAFILEIYL